eukprot:SAG31_NODE_1323_length_8792_cov_16.597032_4_plen_47_part_00
MHRLYTELDKLGTRLLRAIALDLGLPEMFFDDAVTSLQFLYTLPDE